MRKLRFTFLLALVLALSLLSNFSIASAEVNITLEGYVKTGLLFDETVSNEMKQGILDANRTIVKTNDGEMMLIQADALTYELTNVSNGNTYKTITDKIGKYNLSNLESGTYKLTVSLDGNPVYTEDNIVLTTSNVHTVLLPLTLDKFLSVTMEPEAHTDDHGENYGATQPNNSTTDKQGDIAFSHKYPNLQCLDFNGWYAPDSKHVHDWSHFYGSDCWLAVYYRCSTDHVNSLEYCDGTQNCSWRIGHSKYYHKN